MTLGVHSFWHLPMANADQFTKVSVFNSSKSTLLKWSALSMSRFVITLKANPYAKRFSYIKEDTSYFGTIAKCWKNFVCIDVNWLVPESPGLNLEIPLAILAGFLKKMRTCWYKVTVQTLYRKLGEKKLEDNFSYTFNHLY